MTLLRSLLATLVVLAAAPAAQAQTDRSPDLAQVALGQPDVEGWQLIDAVRSETWDPTDAAAPSSQSDVHWYETRFERDLPDGTQQTLTTRATQGRPDLATAYFEALQHDALGQTQIAVPPLGDQALGWWEAAANMRNATAAAQIGNVTVEIHVGRVTQAADVSDAAIIGWLSTLVARATGAADATQFDWTQALPGQPGAARFVLDPATVGADWEPQTGLVLSAHLAAGQIDRVSATREFTRTGVYVRSLDSSSTVYASASDADLSGDGTPLDLPTIGDASAAFRSVDASDANESPTVTYTFKVRRANVVMTTEESGVPYSLTTPDETAGLARLADTQAANVLASSAG
jgi:hypothetical protein